MNEIIEKENVKIEKMIYEIRGKQVMLSSDVAKLYQVETRRINEVIKRNINRFPITFCFQLTNEEVDGLSLRSQFATLNKNNNLRGQHYKYLPYVLTEQGIMMLSGLLKSDVAVKVNIEIIEAFVKMRKYFATNNEILINHENRLLLLENTLDKLSENRAETGIFYKGQMYDAYSAIIDVFGIAKEGLIIVDSYADKVVLDIIRRLSVKVIIITKPNNLLTKQDIEKYNKQYHNLKVIFDKSFHDRFFVIDNSTVFYCGASINGIGYKTFFIGKVEDFETSKFFISRVDSIMNMVR